MFTAQLFTIHQERLRVLHLRRRVAHHARVVARVVAAQVVNDQNAIILIHLLDGHVLRGVDGAAVLAPVDGQWQIALHHGAGERGAIAHVQLQYRRLERTETRRHCKWLGQGKHE